MTYISPGFGLQTDVTDTMVTLTDMVYSSAYPAACLLDVYLPDSRRADSLFLYLHGGGLECGDRKCAVDWASLFTERGIALASADYRMYPSAVFPEFIEDCAGAAAWLVRKNGTDFAFRHLFIGGSSAGAYLAMMLCFDRYYLGAYGIDSLRGVTGYVFDAGQPTTHFNVLRERGLDTRLVRIDEAAPLWSVGPAFAACKRKPAFLFFVAENDMENRLEQNQLLMRTMQHFGCPSERIEYHLMRRFSHCEYTGNPAFLDTISSFIVREGV